MGRGTRSEEAERFYQSLVGGVADERAELFYESLVGEAETADEATPTAPRDIGRPLEIHAWKTHRADLPNRLQDSSIALQLEPGGRIFSNQYTIFRPAGLDIGGSIRGVGRRPRGLFVTLFVTGS